MIIIYDTNDAAQLTDNTLHALVQNHLARAKKHGLENLTCIAVIEPADNEETIIEALGFSPLRNPLTETRFGDPDFTPAWNWLEVHSGWYELIFTMSNDGFAYILFVPSKDGPIAELCWGWGGTKQT